MDVRHDSEDTNPEVGSRGNTPLPAPSAPSVKSESVSNNSIDFLSVFNIN